MAQFRSKGASFVLIAATALLAMAGSANAAKSSSSTFDKLFEDPNNVDLNRKYAAEAEAQGKLRLALSALERARAVRPDDREIFREFERVRAELLPATTSVTWQVGGAYASNPRQANAAGPLKHNDGIIDGAVMVQDERTILGKRWRTFAYAAGQANARFEQIDAARAFVESGPLFPLTEKLWLQVAPGASTTMIDGKLLYNDVSAATTLGASFWGMTQTFTARYTWRFGENFNYSDAELFEVNARLASKLGVVRGDIMFLEPRYRLSRPESSQPTTVEAFTILGFTNVARDISPLEYQEWGARASYMFPVMKGKAWLGAGLAIYERHFDAPVLDPASLALGVPVGTDNDRHDVYFEPTAHLILPNLVAPNVDLRFDYRFEKNTSNDNSREYENHVAGMRIVGRF